MVGRDMASVLSQLPVCCSLPLGTRLSLVLPLGWAFTSQAVSSLGLLTQWSYRPLVQVRTLRTEGFGVHGTRIGMIGRMRI